MAGRRARRGARRRCRGIDGLRAAEVVVAGLSQHDVSLTTGFTGSELFVFGAVRRTDARPEPTEKLDVIIAITGPSEPVVVRRKERRSASGPTARAC